MLRQAFSETWCFSADGHLAMTQWLTVMFEHHLADRDSRQHLQRLLWLAAGALVVKEACREAIVLAHGEHGDIPM